MAGLHAERDVAADPAARIEVRRRGARTARAADLKAIEHSIITRSWGTMPRSAMVFAHVRRVGRLFSIVLLLWTAVDLVEHFSPDLGPRMTGVQGASVGQ